MISKIKINYAYLFHLLSKLVVHISAKSQPTQKGQLQIRWWWKPGCRWLRLRLSWRQFWTEFVELEKGEKNIYNKNSGSLLMTKLMLRLGSTFEF